MIKRAIAALATLLAMAGAFAYGYRAASVQLRPVQRGVALHGRRTPLPARGTHAIDTSVTVTRAQGTPPRGLARRPMPPGRMLAVEPRSLPTATTTSLPTATSTAVRTSTATATPTRQPSATSTEQ